MVAQDPFDKLDSTQSAKPKKIVKKASPAASANKSAPKKAPTKRRRRRKTRQKTQVKQGSKVSATWFFVWCGIFVVLFLLLMIGWVFWVIQSPWTLEWLWMDIGQVKTLLYLFSSLFFWILSLWLLFSLFLSIYRIATRKWSKLKYILGILFSLIFLITVVVWWIFAIRKINELNSQKRVTNNPVISYVETKDGPVFAESWIPIIAPLTMTYKLNDQIYTSQILNDIWRSSSNINISLDCWNGQTLSMANNGEFQWRCLFMEKESYEMTMNVSYRNTKWEDQSTSYPAGTFTPQAAIDVTPLNDTWTYNDDKDEFIIWIAPAQIRFKSELLFTDLGLDNDNIERDFDADDEIDYTDQATFQRTLNDSKLHKIAYRLPQLPWEWSSTWFLFDLRVIESELAWCFLNKENIRENRRKITPSFDEDLNVSEYRYTIYDTINEEVISSPRPDLKGAFSYTFPEWAKYEVSMVYFTDDKKKWACAPVEVSEWYEWSKAIFELFHKHKVDDSYKRVEVQGENASYDGERIFAAQIPSHFQIKLEWTTPDTDADVAIYFDWSELFPQNNVYEIKATKQWTFDLEFVVTTKEWSANTQIIPVTIARNSVKADMKVAWDLVWDSPFQVTLDASISPLYDEDDEIVFFTWDFWDWEILNKVSQWKVRHTYVYDTENDIGEFYPKVTVQTRKWSVDTYRLEEPIIVKKKQKDIEIILESHPTQLAKAWEVVRLSVRTDWLVDKIDRDFWNLKVLSCDSRECSSTAVTYDEPWVYDISVEVSYKDNIPAVKQVSIQVF